MQARVRKGRLVLDVATKLPEGSVVDLVLADDDDLALDHAERAKRDASVRRGIAEGRAGRTVTVDAVARAWRSHGGF